MAPQLAQCSASALFVLRQKPQTRSDSKWHLGIDDEEPKNTKKHYKFPYGDFEKVHRCALLSAESRAGQYKHFDIERVAAHLHGMIEELGQRVA